MENAKDFNRVMSMFLLEYGKNQSNTIGSLWECCVQMN